MNIPFLILAQVITAYTYPPDAYGGRMSDIRIRSMPDPLINYSSRLNESRKIGQAVRTGQVYDPFSGQTMIKTQAPASPYHNMSREQATKIREAESENMAREVSIRSAEFKQKADAMDYKYRLNEIDQSEKYLARAPELDPNQQDYPQQKARLDKEFPLAGLNADVQRKMALLDQTYSRITENDRLLNRHAVEQEAREAAALRKQEISQGRTIVSKYGPNALVAFEEELAKDDKTSPIAVAAKLEDASRRLSMMEQLRELGVDDRRFYTPDDSGRLVFDVGRAESIIKSTPTASQAHQAAASRERIRENNVGKYEEWAPDVQADYDLFGEQVQRYKSLSGQKQEKTAPTIKSVDDFF